MTDDQTRQYETPASTPPPAGEPASSAPAAGVTPATTSSGPSRGRLLAGLGVAGVVLALTAGAVLLLGGATTPEALRYVPVDSAVVVELRMDLPGDQMQKLGNVLSNFPGFADQATLTAKIDEAFTQFVSSVSGGEADYENDVKPWLNGPFFLAADAEAMAASDEAPGRFLVSATTNNGVSCSTTFEGQPVTTETYRGVELTLATSADMPVDGQAACAVDGRFALVGDAASVREALDTKAAGTGIDTSAAYTSARSSLAGEQLGTMWLSGEALRAAAPSPDPSFAVPGLDALGGAIPDWFILGLRAEDDAFVMDAVAAPVDQPDASLLPLPPAHASTLAGMVPAGTLIYLEDQGTGVNLRNLLTTLRSIPELEEALAVLDGMASAEDLVGWIEESAIAVSATGSDPENAMPELTLLLAATDAAAATERVTAVTSLLGLLGMGGEGITVTESTIAGVTATTVTITDLGAVIPPGSIPDVGETPLEGELSFSIASKDRVVYLTIGEGTIEKVLGLQPGASLADDAAFKAAGARGLQNSRTTLYVAVDAAMDLAEPLLVEAVGADWTEVKPYLDPVQAVGGSTTSDASGTRFRTVVTVGTP